MKRDHANCVQERVASYERNEEKGVLSGGERIRGRAERENPARGETRGEREEG